jgi:hypothetical protein
MLPENEVPHTNSWVVLYFPPVQKVLSTAPVSAEIYFLAWLGIPLIFGLDYIRKKIGKADKWHLPFSIRP